MAVWAPALVTLDKQIDKAFPRRKTGSDGWIGDAAHRSRPSDHNPQFDPPGPVDDVVMAGDWTHDPKNGFDCDQFTDELAASRDRRIAYMIFNGWIMDSRPGNKPWQWVRYHGANKHTSHVHLSAMRAFWDDTRAWSLPMLGRQAPPPPPPAPTKLPVHRTGSRTLRLTTPRMSGTDVRDLQRILNAWYPSLRMTQDGVFGPITEDAVRTLQRGAGIRVDGIAGPQTFRVLHIL